MRICRLILRAVIRRCFGQADCPSKGTISVEGFVGGKTERPTTRSPPRAGARSLGFLVANLLLAWAVPACHIVPPLPWIFVRRWALCQTEAMLWHLWLTPCEGWLKPRCGILQRSLSSEDASFLAAAAGLGCMDHCLERWAGRPYQ